MGAAMEFTPPDFVDGNDVETIHARMMEALPEDIDDMPGGFPYDFTMPAAIEKAELVQYHLTRTLQLMFPMWAWGSWLDLHAASAGLVRRPAGRAYGVVLVEGSVGASVPAGTVFSTEATDAAPREYLSVRKSAVGENGTAEVEVEAVEAGIGSNVMAGMVSVISSPVQGITGVVNPEPVRGGTDEEDDESLRERIMEAFASGGTSFVGNISDYLRWAKEVTGVGGAVVVPEWDGPGTVKVIVTDGNGEPANEHIRDEVYRHIVSPDEPLNRLAPIGAAVTVAAPGSVPVSYSVDVVLKEGYELDMVKAVFLDKLKQYYKIAVEEGAVMYNHAASFLYHTEGIRDFRNLKINGGTGNIPLDDSVYPRSVIERFEVMS